MYNKPITQRAKSPLKNEKPGNIVVSDTKTIKGTEGTAGTPGASTTTYSYNGKLDSGVYDALQGEMDSGFAKKKYGFEGTNVKDYEQFKLGNMKSPNVTATTTETEGTPGTPGTPDSEEKTVSDIYTRDTTDAIRPYAAYQNRIVERREGGKLERSAKRNLSNLAKRYAQDTDDDGKKGFGKFLSNRKQKRDFKRGNVTLANKDKQNQAQELRDYRDGVSKVQLDMSDNVQALERARDQRKQGASGNDDVISDPRLANQTDIQASDVQGQLENSVGNVEFTPFKKMYDKNVGIKTATPMKKGYFKGK